MKNKKLSDYLISIEFNQIKNKEIQNEIASQSPKKYWWICTKGHEWEASCNLRIGKGRNCPYCSNQKVCKDNCLAILYPDVAKEWHTVKNGSTTPYDIVSGTPKQYWWICNKNHEWEAGCVKRIAGKGCPFCKNRKVCNDNCLATLHPDIAKEWHTIKNGNITPYDIIAGTANKYWWKCKKGHEWQTSCVKRTRENRGCPICKESHGEKSIRNYLENNNISFDSQHKFNTCRRILPLVFDFVIYRNNTMYCIEYQGEQHYKQVKHFKDKKSLVVERDNIKRNWCKNNNITLLEIPYFEYKNITSILNDFFKLNTC